MVTGLHHVNIEVTDVARAAAFYRALGLREIPRLGEANRPGVWFELADGKQIHLGKGAPQFGNWHFAILVDDLDAARRALISGGALPEEARELPGYRRFFVRDPDGNRIEVTQRRNN